MSADAAEEPLVEEALSLFDSGYLGTDDTTEYAVHYDGELGPAERYAEEEPRGRPQKRRLSLEDEEQDGKGSDRSRLRRRMSKMVSMLLGRNKLDDGQWVSRVVFLVMFLVVPNAEPFGQVG